MTFHTVVYTTTIKIKTHPPRRKRHSKSKQASKQGKTNKQTKKQTNNTKVSAQRWKEALIMRGCVLPYDNEDK
jgi:Tfp pilus assembly protein PilV